MDTLEMDTNTVKREIRPVAVTRKAALFAGSEGGGANWAIAATLIRTAILNGVDPQAWLTDVLEQMVSGKVNSRAIATRFEKHDDKYLALVKLAAARIWMRFMSR
jgi:transposase